MFRRTFTATAFAVFFCLNLNAAELTQIHSYGWNYDFETASEIAQTPDEGFVYTAAIADSAHRNADPTLVMKFDALGKKTWETTLTDIVPCKGGCLLVTKDGDIYVAGHTPTEATYSKLAKLDAKGELLWELVFKDPNYRSEIASIALSPLGDVVGLINLVSITNQKNIVFQFSPEGKNKKWSVSAVPTRKVTFRSMAVNPDGTFLVVGASFDGTQKKGLVAKYSSECEPLVERLAEQGDEYSQVIRVQDRYVARKEFGGRTILEVLSDEGKVKRSITSLARSLRVERLVPLSGDEFAIVGGSGNPPYSVMGICTVMNLSGVSSSTHLIPKRQGYSSYLRGVSNWSNNKLILLGDENSRRYSEAYNGAIFLYKTDHAAALPPPPPAAP